jgi:CyaY protein
MEEREFNLLADRMLASIEDAIDGCGADVDLEVKPGGVLELEFDDGSKIIINRHSAAREIWVAARSGGYHFRPEGGRWIGTRDGEELMTAIARCMAEQSGRPVSGLRAWRRPVPCVRPPDSTVGRPCVALARRQAQKAL